MNNNGKKKKQTKKDLRYDRQSFVQEDVFW